ncbi:MAG TPA: nitroreductase [Chitinophagaceae bacterium]|nr:nitroreductase [Chitinophagaceae bacterium]
MNSNLAISQEAFHQLIRSRRSVFIDQFDPSASIPDETVAAILESANYAPTHKHTEPWRFTVYSGAGLQKLANDQAAVYQKFAGEKFKQKTYEKLLENPLRCSHVVAIGLKRHDSVPEVEEIAAVGCAMQNVYLSMTVHGVGGYWSTGGVTYYEQAKSLFGLGAEDRLMGFLFMGVVKTPSPMRHPRPFEDKISWIK